MNIRKKSHQPIMAADDDYMTLDDIQVDEGDPDSGLSDDLDDMADQVEDMQDEVDELDEDEVDIERDNNIDGHYIAECDVCHGVFISAVMESDQEVEFVSGLCPLCQKESDQYLKWVIKSINKK